MGEKSLHGFEVLKNHCFSTSQQAIDKIKEWKDNNKNTSMIRIIKAGSEYF